MKKHFIKEMDDPNGKKNFCPSIIHPSIPSIMVHQCLLVHLAGAGVTMGPLWFSVRIIIDNGELILTFSRM
jgi:hypothetical protein